MTPLHVPDILRYETSILFPSRHKRSPARTRRRFIGLPPGRNATVHCNAPQDEILHWERLQRKGMNWLHCVESWIGRRPRQESRPVRRLPWRRHDSYESCWRCADEGSGRRKRQTKVTYTAAMRVFLTSVCG
jgi:hypothetical protein